MLSCIINLDTRPQRLAMEQHNAGVTCSDLLVGNILNKRRFFQGFDAEFIAYIDVHEPVPEDALRELNRLCDCVVLRKHSKKYRGADPFNVFNDIAYLQALSQARGEIVAHFDMDTACFARDKEAVEAWLSNLESYRFVSYPSPCSPRPVDDASFGKHTWASTRAFACKREWLKFDALERMLREPEWGWEQFGEPVRKLNWLEHMLALSNNESVIYPPRCDDRLLMFCWSAYHRGVMEKLNGMSFDEVKAYADRCGGVTYPNDVFAQPL
jgi:hypothetical protein